jgi:hypothetical protein
VIVICRSALEKGLVTRFRPGAAAGPFDLEQAFKVLRRAPSYFALDAVARLLHEAGIDTLEHDDYDELVAPRPTGPMALWRAPEADSCSSFSRQASVDHLRGNQEAAWSRPRR